LNVYTNFHELDRITRIGLVIQFIDHAEAVLFSETGDTKKPKNDKKIEYCNQRNLRLFNS
jgi:hypothetical protein